MKHEATGVQYKGLRRVKGKQKWFQNFIFLLKNTFFKILIVEENIN